LRQGVVDRERATLQGRTAELFEKEGFPSALARIERLTASGQVSRLENRPYEGRLSPAGRC